MITNKNMEMSHSKNNKRERERERVNRCLSRSLKTASLDEASTSKRRNCHKDAPVVKGTFVFVRRKILIPTPTTRPGAFISFAVIF